MISVVTSTICLQVLPKAVPSLCGAFPEGMQGELQGFVSKAELEEGHNRTNFEFSKIKESPLNADFTEFDFRWAYLASPAGASIHHQAYIWLLSRRIRISHRLISMAATRSHHQKAAQQIPQRAPLQPHWLA